MKTRIILFAAAIVVLLSFTFVNGPKAAVAEQQVATTENVQGGGIVIEDKAEW